MPSTNPMPDPKEFERRVMTDGRPAPALMVRMACKKCNLSWVVDVYAGIPICPTHGDFLEGVALVKHGHPLADIEAMRQTDRGRFS